MIRPIHATAMVQSWASTITYMVFDWTPANPSNLEAVLCFQWSRNAMSAFVKIVYNFSLDMYLFVRIS